MTAHAVLLRFDGLPDVQLRREMPSNISKIAVDETATRLAVRLRGHLERESETVFKPQQTIVRCLLGTGC